MPTHNGCLFAVPQTMHKYMASREVLAWSSVMERGANDLHMVQLMPLSTHPSFLASLKSRMVYLSGAGLPRLS